MLHLLSDPLSRLPNRVAHDVKQKAGHGGGRASEDEGGGGIYDFRLTIYDLRN